MATGHDLVSVTKTLSGTTADTITLDQLWPFIQITNSDASNTVWVRSDGTNAPTAAVASGAGCIPILPLQTRVIQSIPIQSGTGIGTTVISCVGNGGTYTVTGINVGVNSFASLDSRYQPIGSYAALSTGGSVLPAVTSGSTAVGTNALAAVDASGNATAVGTSALAAQTSGIGNTAVGHQALQATTTNGVNTAVGYVALRALTTGTANAAFGANAGQNLTTGHNNTLLGYSTGTQMTTATTSVAIGSTALTQMLTGIDNVAIGYGALSEAQGSFNVGVGRETLANYSTAQHCVALGNQAMGWGRGNLNTAIGDFAMLGAVDGVHLTTPLVSGVAITTLAVQATPYAITSGDSIVVRYLGNTDTFTASGAHIAGVTTINVNSQAPTSAYSILSTVECTGPGTVWANTFTQCTAIGSSSLRNLTTGANNVGVGTNSLLASTTADRNVAVGAFAGSNVTTGNHNVFVGYNAGITATGANGTTTGANQTFVGYQSGQAFNASINNCTAFGHQATVGTNGTAVGQGALATGGASGLSQSAFGQGASANVASPGKGGLALGASTSVTAAGAVAIGTDSAGTGASTSTQDKIKLGTALHTVDVIGNATFVGASGTLGFYGHSATALQTGVAVTAAGIHAALVNLGLITA